MMTISGVLVSPTGGEIPPLEDFAYGLKQLPRFAGHTIVRWTVLEHLLACMEYSRNSTQSGVDELYVGLHDAHEAFTNDVPKDFKTTDLQELQDYLDIRIYRALGLLPPSTLTFMPGYVKYVDRLMLVADAKVVCPAKTYQCILNTYANGEEPAELPHAVQAVHAILSGDEGASFWVQRINYLLRTNGGIPR